MFLRFILVFLSVLSTQSSALICTLPHVLLTFKPKYNCFCEDVGFEVHGPAEWAAGEGGAVEGGGDEGHFKMIVFYGGDGEADAVEGDGALRDDKFGEFGRGAEGQACFVGAVAPGEEFGDAVDVALDDMAIEAGCGQERALEMDFVAGAEVAEVGEGEGLGDDIEFDFIT